MYKRIYDIVRLNFAIYPGICNYRSAIFLDSYYKLNQKNQSYFNILINAIVYLGFQLWLRKRVKNIAKKWDLGESWRSRALAICAERFVDPREIALNRIQSAEEMDFYFRRFEHICVGRTIANSSTDHSELLCNKAMFYNKCLQFDIRHPQMLMCWRKDKIDIFNKISINYKNLEELFVKPANGTGGMGAFTFSLEEGEDLTAGLMRLSKYLEANCNGEWVVQAKHKAHPELLKISCSALPTARIITLLNETGEPEIVSTVLRFAATEYAIVDNIRQGGLCAAIDQNSGILSGGCSGYLPEDHAVHPISGEPINGRLVPDWDAAKALALEAHRKMMLDYVMIGWDVGLTENGPLLMEANPRPCTILMQRPTRTPVGKTRMGDLIAWHLDKRLRECHVRKALYRA